MQFQTFLLANIAYDHTDMTKGFISFRTILTELVKKCILIFDKEQNIIILRHILLSLFSQRVVLQTGYKPMEDSQRLN